MSKFLAFTLQINLSTFSGVCASKSENHRPAVVIINVQLIVVELHRETCGGT